jgi:hypothetical protein
VITYNARFDAGILGNEILRLQSTADGQSAWKARAYWLDTITWCCAMALYAQWVGEWSHYHRSYRWQPLPGGDHTALGDCLATLRLLQRIAAGPEHEGAVV